jgi:UPF0176 protein
MMKPLHNRIERRLLRQRMLQNPEPRHTLSFYKYTHIPQPRLLRDHLYWHWSDLGILGRVHVANEGINAQISVPHNRHVAFLDFMSEISFFTDLRYNYAVEDNGKSFFKLTIKVRDKILADGLEDDKFDVTQKGKHLTASQWNEMLERDDVIVVDMRNHYESEVGKFEKAITPDVDTFAASLPIIDEMLKNEKDKKLLLYCTGGIRCEKASAWYKYKGFSNVYQLEGGIIKYARDCKEKGINTKFHGKNFVFDERLGERITDEVIAQCHTCGNPSDTHTNCRNSACNVLFIQCVSCQQKLEGCCSNACIKVMHLPAEEQRILRTQKDVRRNVFRKGRRA